MRVALVTCQQPPEHDADEALLVEALRGADLEARVLAWDDPQAPFAEQDLVVLRSTWNYYQQAEAFRAWVERTSTVTRMLNPAHVVGWNMEKTYLEELAKRGVAIVPTEIVRQGAAGPLEELLGRRGWDEVVIKPLVSAGSFRTARFSRTSAAAAQQFLEALTADRDAMVQRWMPAVETSGERSLVWIDGAFTHAIRKSPRFAGGAEHVSGALAIADDERAFAASVLEPLAAELLYARVDIVRDADGALCLMELELIEPSLFLRQAPRALERLVAAVAAMAPGP